MSTDPGRYFEDQDAAHEPTLWHERWEDDQAPALILQRCDLRPEYRVEMWPRIVKAVCGDE